MGNCDFQGSFQGQHDGYSQDALWKLEDTLHREFAHSGGWCWGSLSWSALSNSSAGDQQQNLKDWEPACDILHSVKSVVWTVVWPSEFSSSRICSCFHIWEPETTMYAHPRSIKTCGGSTWRERRKEEENMTKRDGDIDRRIPERCHSPPLARRSPYSWHWGPGGPDAAPGVSVATGCSAAASGRGDQLCWAMTP